MKQIPLTIVGALAFALTACVPQPQATPPVQVRPTPAPAVTPPPPPVMHDNWMDAPATPGDWSYRPAASGGTAFFGSSQSEGRFSLRCDRNARAVVLTRAGQSSGPTTMTVRSESQTRSLPATPVSGQLVGVGARLAAGDRLLDAIALSKGRFAIEVPGTPALYLPSWAEVTRVIEDCR